MSLKAVNLKLDENRVSEIKNVAEVFHMTITDVINYSLDEYLSKMKNDPFYKLTSNVMEASVDESCEILEEINKLSDDDLKIASTKTFKISKKGGRL